MKNSMDVPYIAVHNHPSGKTFSIKDTCQLHAFKQCQAIVVISNEGKNAYIMRKTSDYVSYDFYPYIMSWNSTTSHNQSYENFLKGADVYGVKYAEKSN